MVTSKRVGLIVLGLLVVASLVAALIWVPQREVAGLRRQLQRQAARPAPAPPVLVTPLDVFNAEDRARQTLATIVGGFLLLVGAYMTWRNVRAAERNAEIARQNAEIAEDKQITDRFTAAVTNLSADEPEKMAQRLGGIYALERIARDSPGDHWTVMEVLTAYVRDKCPRNKIAELEAKLDAAEAEKQKNRVLPTDIQAILTVIGRRETEQDKSRKLEIYSVNLFGAYLVGANLEQAFMGDAILAKANLMEGKLKGAHLVGVDLAGAFLGRTNLAGANLEGANLEEANLVEAYLEGAEMAACLNLTQQQLDSADPAKGPASLPPGLHFPAQAAPKLSPSPILEVPPAPSA